MNNKNNETVRPMTQKQLADIIATMTVNIPELSRKEAQDIIGDKSRFAGEVKKLFNGFIGRQRDSYNVTVNCNRSLKRMIKADKYDWVSSDITADHFPVKGKGKYEADVALFHFDRTMESEDVIAEMDKEGYRPAVIEELAALGEGYPELQRQFPIIALGSVWQDSSGSRYVPSLRGHGSERNFNLDWFARTWRAHCRFAAVRKQ